MWLCDRSLRSLAYQFAEKLKIKHWFKCSGCDKWFHETCTLYGDYWVTYTREKPRAANVDCSKKKVIL